MIQFDRFLMLSVLLITLLGCKQNSTYLYFFRHPDVLQAELANCLKNDSPECKTVKRAANDFVVLNNQRQDNPEQFGLKILLAQEALAKLHNNQEAYKAQQEQIDAMLAVVATTSPE